MYFCNYNYNFKLRNYEVPISDSSGISHRSRHDKERIGWYSVLETVDVAQEVGQVEAHS